MREFLLDLDERDGRRAGLERALRSAIRDGRLPAGTLLPSTRVMATDYSMARATVVAAYEQLAIEGYLVAHQGAGTRVAEVQQSTAPPATDDQPWPVSPSAADFRPGEPDGSSFPRSTWGQAVRRVLANVSEGALGYADPRGTTELRTVLAEYLGRSRAVVATPGSISVFGGVTSSFGFLGEAFRMLGIQKIAVENPNLTFLNSVFMLHGIEFVPVPVDEEGLVVDRLVSLDVGAVIVTPAHQFPLGVTMSAERRTSLLEWARSTSAWIIEDDYDGEFRYDRRPIGSLQGLDPDRVIYTGTASKMLSPALRLSWMVLPEALRAPVAQCKHLRGGVSTIEQLALADFIDRGDLDRHLRSCRSMYHERRTALGSVLADSAPWLATADTEAGLHMAATILDDSLSEDDVIAQGAEAGVELLGFAPMFMGEPTVQGLVLGYSRPASHQFASALERLGGVLSSIG